VWSWDITYLPTTVRGVWLYLYLVIDVWSRKVVAWDVAEREDPAIAADLISRACIRERISKGRNQPLILHADNGNAMRAATLESRLEELGVLRSFSRPRVSNDNPYSESLFRTAKYRPDYPSRPFSSAEDACLWVASFANWYNHRHRHSSIKFVTPQQRHSGQAVEICRPECRLRAGSSATSAPVVTIHPLLASTGGGLDQPATPRKRISVGYVCRGCLNGSRGVIFPGSHRTGPGTSP
jgi:transposase-like protein